MTQVTGMIKKIFDANQVTEKFIKRDIVITTNEMYPQDVLIQFSQDKCAVLDNFKENQQVAIDINIRGREWVSPQNETKYFVTLEGWKINADTSSLSVPQQQPTHSDIPENDANNEDDDLLPF